MGQDDVHSTIIDVLFVGSTETFKFFGAADLANGVINVWGLLFKGPIPIGSITLTSKTYDSHDARFDIVAFRAVDLIFDPKKQIKFIIAQFT